ncbi:MAG TPA: PA14 domain-containing protein, partial [Anaerolineae bacterium]
MGLVGMTFVVLLIAIVLLVSQWGAGNSGAITPTSTPTAATSSPNQPRLITAANPISAGSPVALFGANWKPDDNLTIFLRDPQQPSDPILAVGTGKVSADGTLAVTFNYPDDPRWSKLTKVDVIVQSVSTTNYLTTTLAVQPPAMATATSTLTATPQPMATSTATSTPTRVPPTATRRPATATATATPQVFTNWRGEYYANTTLTGAPIFMRNDAEVSFNWGRQSPITGWSADNFSVRWTRSLLFAARVYRFSLVADDGVRLLIDGVPIIEEWHTAAPIAYTRDVNLAAGWHSIRVEYYEATGDAFIQFKIEDAQSYPDWKSEYYSNPSLTGLPTLVRNDVAVGFDWGTGAPASSLPADRFSARWTRSVQFDTAETYNFSLRRH